MKMPQAKRLALWKNWAKYVFSLIVCLACDRYLEVVYKTLAQTDLPSQALEFSVLLGLLLELAVVLLAEV